MGRSSRYEIWAKRCPPIPSLPRGIPKNAKAVAQELAIIEMHFAISVMHDFMRHLQKMMPDSPKKKDPQEWMLEIRHSLGSLDYSLLNESPFLSRRWNGAVAAEIMYAKDKTKNKKVFVFQPGEGFEATGHSKNFPGEKDNAVFTPWVHLKPTKGSRLAGNLKARYHEAIERVDRLSSQALLNFGKSIVRKKLGIEINI